MGRLFGIPSISSIFLPLAVLLFTVCNAATLINIQNHCFYTVWAAAVPGGGRQLTPGQSWSLTASPGTARIWGRTNCSFDSAGNGTCQTGDCGGRLRCQANGTPPNTLVEFALNQFNNMDLFDISLVDGFNLPVALNSTSSGCARLQCAADIVGQCPAELRVPGGCNHPCTVFKTEEYCCNSGAGSCESTAYSRFFKNKCPEAYYGPTEGGATTLSCPAGTNYDVIFCP